MDLVKGSSADRVGKDNKWLIDFARQLDVRGLLRIQWG